MSAAERAEEAYPPLGTRVLFEEDGDLVTGTTVNPFLFHVPRGQVAIRGDRGGIHSASPSWPERWWWPLTEVAAALARLAPEDPREESS